MEKLVIWGASGHAKVVADIIRLIGNYEIIGFLDDLNPQRQNTLFADAPILGGQEQLDSLLQKGVEHIILGFGDCAARLRLSEFVRGKGFSLATAIHPRSIIANYVNIRAGTVVVAGAVVNPGGRIGENVILNTSASVDHDCVIEDGVHICPGVRLAGKVSVGRGAWVGIGATVIDGMRIGAGAIIGAGAVVVDDIPDNVVAFGNPAKIIKQVSE